MVYQARTMASMHESEVRELRAAKYATHDQNERLKQIFISRILNVKTG